LKEGLNALLQTKYPKTKYKYYSMAVVEGYDRPCFFTQIRPIDASPVNYNTRHHQVVFYITILQKQVDEEEMLRMIQEVQDLFGLNVKIEKKSLNVTDFDWQYAGTDRNVPEISIGLEWLEKIVHEVNEPLVERVITEKEMEE